MSWDIKLCAELTCLQGSEKFRNFAPPSPIIFQHFTPPLQSDQPLINFSQVVTSRVTERKVMTGPLFILLLQFIKAVSMLLFCEEVFKYLEEQDGKLEAKILIEYVELCYKT